MTKRLTIGLLERRLATGKSEHIEFELGVNLLVGIPNTGKTKYLQTLNFLLGDPGENPFASSAEDGLAEKYNAAVVELLINNDEKIKVERRWQEVGAKGKVFVDGEPMGISDFQEFLLKKLEIPILHFPKGNPMSGQTWPELSFRMLLRHIYRQQRFWGNIAELQPEGEQHACLLQFLGLAERIFSSEYGQVIDLKIRINKLAARKEQYQVTLDELTKDVLSQPGLTVGVNEHSIKESVAIFAKEIETLRKRRVEVISNTQKKLFNKTEVSHMELLGSKRIELQAMLGDLKKDHQEATKRVRELSGYRSEVSNELDRLTRASEAGAVFADLKITHCPACDQSVEGMISDAENCFLCHQVLPKEPVVENLGKVRVDFESDRLNGEIKEVDQLLDVLHRDVKRYVDEARNVEEQLQKIEEKLVLIRQNAVPIVQEEVSSIDMELGVLGEKQRQLGRLSLTVEKRKEYEKEITKLEEQIQKLQIKLSEGFRESDFDKAGGDLEDGMNTYLNAINAIRPKIWKHHPVRVNISRNGFSLKVGTKGWQAALGGTDQLYFLMAYHYGLLTLSGKNNYHYPGLSVIDVPGEFSGEAVGDKEDFIVQPFIDLLARDEYKTTQLIITGVSFSSLKEINRILLTKVHVA